MPEIAHLLPLPLGDLPVSFFWNQEPGVRWEGFPNVIEDILPAMLLEKVLEPWHQVLEQTKVDVVQDAWFKSEWNCHTTKAGEDILLHLHPHCQQ